MLDVLTISMQGTLVPELDELLSLGVGLFSLALLAVTLIAYRKNRQRRLLFVSGAFGLFAAKTLVRHLDILIFNWGSSQATRSTSLAFILIAATNTLQQTLSSADLFR